ncbi:hypothetical protein [Brevibacillus sp. IT-7CA2]|uniref:hypothetical protein n=1 Tax=Brevibacillus sp. IT-7CA2 TaxID=3026436 RepID=UPI0039E04D75
MAKGVADRATSALNYAGDVITGNKSAREIGTDALETAWSGAKGVYSDVIEPFVKDGQYMLEDTQGGSWTRSIEESYEKGRNRGKQDLVIAELLLSRGAASAYKQGAKKVIDLEPDGHAQHGKRDGGNRTGLLLDGADNHRNSSSSLKGGKLKTQAKSFTESLTDLQKQVDKLLKQMGNMLGGVAVFREVYTGEYRFYFVRHDDLPGNGGGGGGNHRRNDNGNEGTGNSGIPKGFEKLAKSANDISEKAKEGKIKYGSGYHGRLGKEKELEILSNYDAIYVAGNNSQNLIYRKGGNVVIVESKGSGKGNVITSYGQDGARGKSGAAIFGGEATDLGMPVTHDIIITGVPTPSGKNMPPATQILP